MNKLDEAEKYAMQEYKVRPANIDVNKEVAWILYLKNDPAKAKEYLQVAKSTNSKDSELLERAAKIEKAKA
jgi:Flp pilus assembly protein TadD